MNKPGDDPPQEPSATGPESAAPGKDQRSGRMSHDERGNSVWEWQLETGVYSRDISTQRLKKLNLNDLSIAETATQQRPPGLGGEPSSKPSPGGGSNPYDNSSTAGGNVGTPSYNSGGKPALKSAPAAPTTGKPMDLKKLQKWMEIRKRVEQNKREEDDDE